MKTTDARCSCGMPSHPNEGQAALLDPGGFTSIEGADEPLPADVEAFASACGVEVVICECGRLRPDAVTIYA